ncbi:MAG: glycoside hydrolase family 3 N-terminal domain-containing protein [Bacteroidota bacterium]
MKSKLLTFLLVAIVSSISNQCTKSYPGTYNTTVSKSDFVEHLLSKLSLEEKVGQMTQVTIDVVLREGSKTEIDLEKLKVAIQEKHVGSILNVNGGAYSLETWKTIINTIQDVALSTPNKIPVVYGIDAIHGTSYTLGSTLFPHNIGMAASRNIELASRAAEITAKETRASGIRWNFDPMLGVARQPLWSRFEESFGEDPHLTTQFGVEIIKAYEGKSLNDITTVASCAKHFIGYTAAQSGKDRTPAYIPERQLRQFYLPPFQEAVKAGTSTVMINSSEINGIPVHSSKKLLTDLLRGELGFNGVVVSDWEDIIRLHVRDRIAATPKEAVRIGINAGIDMSMVPYDYSFYDLLLELVNEGKISEKRIDQSVRRILLLKEKLGLFENAYVEEEAISQFNKKEYQETAYNAAKESITLLKNDNNILPLSKKAKVLLAGPSANNLSSLHSSWSYTWQGDNESLYPASTQTVKEAFEEIIGSENVLCASDKTYDHPSNTSEDVIKVLAKEADVIVLCLGERAYAESPGVINDLTLSQDQLTLAKAASTLEKPIVLVLVEGRPRIISEIEPLISGILLAYRPASMGAKAIAEVVFGDLNPSGKLPFTYPRFTGDLLTYDHKLSETFTEYKPGDIHMNGYNPQWPFGFGLSYTDFTYGNIQISNTRLQSNETLTVQVDVKNIGPNDGSIAVEMYCRDLYASVTPPVKQLKGFKKIRLNNGQQKNVSFEIKPSDLFIIDQNNNQVVEEGDFEVMIGNQKAKFTFQN